MIVQVFIPPRPNRTAIRAKVAEIYPIIGTAVV